jgi:peroxiredoxin
MKKIFLLLSVLILGVPFVFSENSISANREFRVGEAVRPFELTDTQGKLFQFPLKEPQIIVLHFWSMECPYVARYEQRLRKIIEDYQSRGVLVVGIDSNITESLEDMRKTIEARQLPYRVLVDANHELANRFGAISTPHVFIIDQFGELVYEGAIDDQGWEEKNKVSENYVRDALNAILEEKSPPHFHTTVFGCTIQREKPAPPATEAPALPAQ